MDATTKQLVDFALQSEFSALSAPTVHACKVRLIDTFGCAIGAYDETLSRSARAIARHYAKTPGVSVWGSRMKTVPEAAAFANGVMLRYLDLSDTYVGKCRGHPSDTIAGVLAVADSIGADGPAVINAVVLAYDVYCSLVDAVDFNGKGWDQPVYGVLAGVLAAGKLMNLSAQQMGDAVALALVPNMALAQTRRGELSTWKGCAGANAARNSVFAALLAREGFTGPPAVFEGKGGLWDIVGRFDIPLPEKNAPHLLPQTHLKSLPICYHGQSAVLAALELRKRVSVDAVREIQVDTYDIAVMMMGADAGRWAPATRETADHSLPYCIAIALLDGEITAHSFTPQRLQDPAVKKLMGLTKVNADPELCAQYPESVPGRVRITTASGEALTAEVRYPTGHAMNPISDADVEKKFRGMFAGRANAADCEQLLKSLWALEQVRDIGREILALPALSGAADD
ncbi:MAG: MmgE/PrpD family protein [Burkholderiales bacterium]